MAKMTIAGSIQNTRNNVTDADGYALPPLAANLKDGQIAINTSDTDPCIFFKTSEGKIVKIVSEEKLTKALTDILGNSAADLDTLRELIAQFEGSANDILPMLVALTDRVTAAETSLTSKADKSALNTTNTNLSNHIGNTSNPHSVTKALIGLGNVVNKEQLGKDETALASYKVVNNTEFSDANSNPTAPSGVYFTAVDGNSSNWKGQYGSGITMARSPGGSTTSTVYTQLFSPTIDLGNLYLRKFKGNNSGLEYGDWCLMWHSGNSNVNTVDWNCNHIITARGILIGSNNPSRLFKNASDVADYGTCLQDITGDNTTNFIVQNGNANINGNTFWHAGNSNLSTVDWTAKDISVENRVNLSPNKPALYFKSTATGAFNSAIGLDTNSTECLGFVSKHIATRYKFITGLNPDSLINGSLVNYENAAFEISDSGCLIKGSTVWHAGNSNKADVDWSASTLYARQLLGHSVAANNPGSWLDIRSTSGNGVDKQGGGLALYAGKGTGTATGGDIQFISSHAGSVSGSSVNPTVINAVIKSNGFMGIGTTDPTEKLDVAGNVYGSGKATFGGIVRSNCSLSKDILDSTVNKGASLLDCGQFAIESNNNALCMGVDDTQNTRIGWLQVGHTHSSYANIYGKLLLNPKGGHVGIGVDVPTEKLDVGGNGKFSGSVFACNNRAIFNIRESDAYLDLLDKTDTRKAIIRSYSANGYQAEFLAGGVKISGNTDVSGNVTAKGDVVAKSTNAVVFSTSDAAVGATRLNDLIDVKLPTNLANKMVLAYDPAQVNSDGSKGGYTFMPSAGTGTGKVSSTEIASLPDHNHNDIVYASDERLKENVIPLRNATIMLNNLRPKEYNWNEKGIKLGLRDPKAYGLIAQEVEGLREIIDLVKPMHGGESGYLGVDYVKLVPVLIAGFQEQHKEIIALNQKLKTIQARANKAYGNETNNADKIAQLEADNSAMRAEIEELKMLIKK